MKINKNKNIKKLTNVCLMNNLETIGRNYTKKNKCIINGMIRRKTSQRSKKTFSNINIYTQWLRNNKNCFSEIKEFFK